MDYHQKYQQRVTHHHHIIVIVIIIIATSSLLQHSAGTEYCHNHHFKADCETGGGEESSATGGPGHVVLMTSALYGRMRKGSCVKTDFGYVGCFSDVLDHLHGRCSGRPSCAMGIPDATLDKSRPCNQDLKSYLEANFTCVNVLHNSGDGSSCDVLVEDSVFLSNRVRSAVSGDQATCGEDLRPWVLRVKPGQRINITLLDFTSKVLYRGRLAVPLTVPAPSFTGGGTLPGGCDQYALISESQGHEGGVGQQSEARPEGQDTRVCGSGNVKDSHVMTSSSHVIQVIIYKPRDQMYNYLLRFQAVGCPDVPDPRYGKTRREGNDLIVTCESHDDDDDDDWYFTCVDNVWISAQRRHSTDRNCSIVSTGARPDNSTATLSLGASVLIILAVSLTIGLVVLLFGLFYMRKKRIGHVIGQEMAMRDVKPLRSSDPNYDATNQMYARNKAFEPVRLRVARNVGGKMLADDGSEYEYTWDTVNSATAPSRSGRTDTVSPSSPSLPPRASTSATSSPSRGARLTPSTPPPPYKVGKPPDVVHQVEGVRGYDGRPRGSSSSTPSSSPHRRPGGCHCEHHTLVPRSPSSPLKSATMHSSPTRTPAQPSSSPSRTATLPPSSPSRGLRAPPDSPSRHQAFSGCNTGPPCLKTVETKIVIYKQPQRCHRCMANGHSPTKQAQPCLTNGSSANKQATPSSAESSTSATPLISHRKDKACPGGSTDPVVPRKDSTCGTTGISGTSGTSGTPDETCKDLMVETVEGKNIVKAFVSSFKPKK